MAAGGPASATLIRLGSKLPQDFTSGSTVAAGFTGNSMLTAAKCAWAELPDSHSRKRVAAAVRRECFAMPAPEMFTCTPPAPWLAQNSLTGNSGRSLTMRP